VKADLERLEALAKRGDERAARDYWRELLRSGDVEALMACEIDPPTAEVAEDIVRMLQERQSRINDVLRRLCPIMARLQRERWRRRMAKRGGHSVREYDARDVEVTLDGYRLGPPIDTATGEDLDRLGAVVGLERTTGVTDAEFREAASRRIGEVNLGIDRQLYTHVTVNPDLMSDVTDELREEVSRRVRAEIERDPGIDRQQMIRLGRAGIATFDDEGRANGEIRLERVSRDGRELAIDGP
jgi:hypothetical protein